MTEAIAREALASHGVEAAGVEAVNAPERLSFFKSREKIHPKRVSGKFRRVKWLMMAVTLGIYYLTPWLRWDRGPGAPSQAVLIDLPGRRFYFFFIELWPQEVYYITGLLILAAISLFLWTSLFGRVWCGYACPQTIWTDLFLVVERAVEGNRNDRIKLDRAPLTVDKLRKRLTKHALWLLIGVATGGAWVFYFADAPTLLTQLVTLSAPAMAYVFVGIFTFTTYGLGGLAREQVCIYMCPWPRIQSAMLDEESLAVTYRHDRGEPRGPHKKGDTWAGRGDCVDCRQCIAACPAGVDIRDGFQLACIQCALCIDACDEIMQRVGRPRGLIGYDTDQNLARRSRGEAPRFRLVRPRTVAYAIVLVAAGSIMLWTLLTRRDVDLSVARDRNPIFVVLTDGGVRNAYTVKISNKAHTARAFRLEIAGAPAAALTGPGLAGGDGALSVAVPPDTLRPVRVLVTVPKANLTPGQSPIRFTATGPDGVPVSVESAFQAPQR